MAFKTKSPSKLFGRELSRAEQLRKALISFIAQAESSDISFETAIDLYQVLLEARAKFLASKDVTNIETAAQADFGPSYVHGDEVDGLVALIETALLTIQALAPKETQSGQEWLNVIRFSGFDVVERTGSPANTAGLRSDLQNIVDEIDVT